MSTLLSKIATVAAIATAAFPAIALGFAHAEPATVRISDLDMSRPAHVAIYQARVERAADKLCASVDGRDLARMAACRKAVHAEADDKLAGAGRVTVASR
jgi:UrcA family protein